LIARIGDGHKCHRKLSSLHRDPAGFLEQLLSISHPDNERVNAAQHGVNAVQPDDSCLRLLSSGDVANEAREQRFRSCIDRPDRQLDRKLRPVGADRLQFKPLPQNGTLAGRQVMRKATVMRFAQSRRDDQLRHDFAERLLTRDAKDRFRRRVELYDVALAVDRYQRIERGLQDRAFEALALTQLLPGTLLLGHVLQRAEPAFRLGRT
jgi:hypothetical protein